MRNLGGVLDGHSTAMAAAAPPTQLDATNSNIAVIIAAMMCALTCVVGLLFALRCTCLRRFSAAPPPLPPLPSPPNEHAQKEKTVLSLSAFPFVPGGDPAECSICLSEYAPGEEIRFLPLCGHAFHVSCVDVWLLARSTCPSCRRTVHTGGVEVGGAAISPPA